MRIRCLRQGIGRRDRHAKPGLCHRTLQLCELARTGRRVICAQANPPTTTGLGFDAVGVRHPPTGTHETEAPLECIAASEGKGGVDAIGRKLPEPFKGTAAPGVDHGVGAEPPNEGGCVATPNHRQHTRPPALRELYR